MPELHKSLGGRSLKNTHTRCQAVKSSDKSISVSSAPCKPSNLITVSDCETDILTSSWDTVDGVTQYIVEGRGNRENISHESYYSCISDTNSCAIPGVACGESLTLKITAFNDDCYSDMVLGQQTNTGK